MSIGFKNFKKWKFYLNSIPGFTLPMDTVVILYNSLKQIDKDKTDMCFYSSAYESYKNILKNITFKNKTDLIKWLNSLTFGHFEISATSGYLLVKNYENKFPERLKFVFGLQPSCVDSYVLGLLTAALENFYSKKLSGEEVSCVACGSKYCLFRFSK